MPQPCCSPQQCLTRPHPACSPPLPGQVVDYLKPSCGACRRVLPKLQQIAEQNPDALFVKVRLGAVL